MTAKTTPAILILLLFSGLIPPQTFAQSKSDTTFAERLGWPKGARLLIIHVDDAGMSLESNEGAINAIPKGVANSAGSANTPIPTPAST
jgi:hypothetical protein